MVTMKQVRQKRLPMVFLLLMNMAIRMPPMKQVKVASTDHTSVQASTWPKE